MNENTRLLQQIVRGHRELIAAQKELKEGLKNRSIVPEIQLPANMHLPAGSQSLDLRNLFDVTAGTTVRAIDFTIPSGAIAQITHFGVFNDGLLASDYDFYPRVDGRRIYVYHGDPLDRFRIYLGTAPDLSNDSLFHAPITLQAGQRLTWDMENRAAVDTSLGVRVVGYIDKQGRTQSRWGG